MSDFNPGPGWREVEWEEAYTQDYLLIVTKNPRRNRYWVREEPVPALPTGPGYYVIQVIKSDDVDVRGQVLFGSGELGYWANSKHTLGPGSARARIQAFEVLSEPRAVTAKAVLDRVRDEYQDDDAALRVIGRDFGVES